MPEVIGRAVQQAGLAIDGSDWREIEASGFGARVWAGELVDGIRVVARNRSRGQADAVSALDGKLRVGAVPAPRLLAAVNDIDGGLTELWTWMEGQPLGRAPRSLLDTDRLWSTVGEAFRCLHTATPPDHLMSGGNEGVAELVTPTLAAASSVASHEPSIDAHMDRIVSALQGAVGRVDDTAIALCHGDPNFLNVLVAGGVCVGIVDWDSAFCGDRHHDIARLDWHCLQHGLAGLPAAFFGSYELPIVESNLAMHRLIVGLLRAADAIAMEAAGVDPRWRGVLAETLAAVRRDLGQVPRLLDAIVGDPN